MVDVDLWSAGSPVAEEVADLRRYQDIVIERSLQAIDEMVYGELERRIRG